MVFGGLSLSQVHCQAYGEQKIGFHECSEWPADEDDATQAAAKKVD